MQIGNSALDFQSLRQQFQQQVFNGLSGGGSGISRQQWKDALQNLPGVGSAGSANSAIGNNAPTATASTVDAAFKSIDTNGDGQLSQSEFNTAMDGMMQRARTQHRHHHQGAAGTNLDAQLLGQQTSSPNDGVTAPDILRRMLLSYGGTAG
jgi:EF hand